MKKKWNRVLTLMVMTAATMLALTACGGYQIETGSVSGGAVSGQAVSGSAVSDSTALNIHVMKEGKVTIPDPAVVEGSADVYLRKSPDDDIYVEDHYAKGTPSHRKMLRPLVGVWFQELFHSPARGSFHLSFTVLVRYRSHGSI